ncbi:hypothetical protein CLOSTMETH_00894 [[Clostridium] methylpentosum DSM 5476]|uniref:Uncharacterized protein n=1 Tax=[Clostridium] methylpentosum DSM 5476 TaxID=537013 RepID=C0EAN1_9FIRM|nr:hypothetical protein CLOSTMETH_00894 [[Clostridium] methylpentosum DSM 5476]
MFTVGSWAAIEILSFSRKVLSKFLSSFFYIKDFSSILRCEHDIGKFKGTRVDYIGS